MEHQEKRTDAAITDEYLNSLMSEATVLLAGAADMTPKTQSGNTTLYGEYRIDNTNPFIKYEQVSEITPHTFIPLTKLGLSILSNFRLESDDNEALKKTQEWAGKVKLLNKLQSIAFGMFRDGTNVVYLAKSDKTEEGIKTLEICPMRYITLLPDDIEPGKRDAAALIKGDVTKAVLNEQKITKLDEQVMEREEIALFRIFPDSSFMKDILDRETYGIYGISALKSVDRTVKNYLDLVEGFSGFMRRYGIGRLHIDVKQAAELRAVGKKAEAADLLEKTVASLRKLAPNEDMITYGTDVKNLATGQITGIDTMKQSLETDIHIGLFQAPLSMGKASGTTYAAGNLSEEDRYIILETIQHIFIETVQTEIIDRQLKLMGIAEGTVKAAVDRLDIPTPDMRSLGEAFINDAITMEEYREMLGFPREKPKPSTGKKPAGAP